MNQTYDFVVIGGGSAGYAAASMAAQLGLTVAVIEGGDQVGGLCILRGCMPSKALLESAHRAEVIRDAARFGLNARFLGGDGAVIQERKKKLVQEFAEYRREQLESGKFTFLRGFARFVGAHELEVEQREGGTLRIVARTVLLATGSSRKRVDLRGLQEASAWGSDEVLESKEIPESVVVLGGGAIAVEIASYYAGFGSRVSLLQRGPHLLSGLDEDVGSALADGLRRRGIEVFCGTALDRVERCGNGWRVVFMQGSVEQSVEGVRVVEALGREPALRGLDLEKAGFAKDTVRLEVARTQQTQVPHIFAAGDVCGASDVVHVAIQQGELAARNAMMQLRGGGKFGEMDDRLALYAVFGRPEVASVGMTEKLAKVRGLSVESASYPFADHGRAMVAGELDGFVKLIVDRGSREILGASVIGAQAAELVHEMVVAIHFRARAGEIAALPHYHPTLSEIWTYPAEALA